MSDINGLKVAILVANGFEQVEFTEPKKALEKAGAQAVVVSPEEKEVQGVSHGEKQDLFPVERALGEARPEEFDALLLPGGVFSPDTLRGTPEALEFVKAFFQDDKPVFAICHGPQTLISAGLVKGRRMTAYHTVQVDLKNAQADCVDEEVVVDGNLVTSRNPKDVPAFCERIVSFLRERASAASGRR